MLAVLSHTNFQFGRISMQNAQMPEIRELTAEEIAAVGGGTPSININSLICQIERTISCVINEIQSLFHIGQTG